MVDEAIAKKFLDNFSFTLVDNHVRELKDKIIVKSKTEELIISLKNALAIEKTKAITTDSMWKNGYNICTEIYDIYYQRRNIDIIVCSEDMQNYILKVRVDGYILFSTPLTNESQFII